MRASEETGNGRRVLERTKKRAGLPRWRVCHAVLAVKDFALRARGHAAVFDP